MFPILLPPQKLSIKAISLRRDTHLGEGMEPDPEFLVSDGFYPTCTCKLQLYVLT